ncbi:hypothetical protein DFH09DRAFT_1067476 [Mycena vulgaris]|nr:hypothetical protein DFH09DRAFT_1067476 [Mycena vulgaris]
MGLQADLPGLGFDLHPDPSPSPNKPVGAGASPSGKPKTLSHPMNYYYAELVPRRYTRRAMVVIVSRKRNRSLKTRRIRNIVTHEVNDNFGTQHEVPNYQSAETTQSGTPNADDIAHSRKKSRWEVNLREKKQDTGSKWGNRAEGRRVGNEQKLWHGTCYHDDPFARSPSGMRISQMFEEECRRGDSGVKEGALSFELMLNG